MPHSHESAPLSIDVSGLPLYAREVAADAVRRLEAALGADGPGADFAEAERRVVADTAAFGRGILRGMIESRDDGAESIVRNGERWRRVGPTRGRVMTLLGEVSYDRARYRRRGEPVSLVPVDESLGLAGGWMTRPAARLAVSTASHVPPREAEEILGRLGMMNPSSSALQKLAGTLHAEWEAIEGAACRREASCGTVSFYGADGKRLNTVCTGRMPESGKERLKAELAGEVARIWSRRPDIALVAVADGAPDNWTFLDSLMPEASAIDFWHACEHLAAAAAFARSPDRWYEKWKTALLRDPKGVDKVVRALRRPLATRESGRGEAARVLEYFRGNRQRMRYREMQDRNLPVGSGVTEAANKVLVGARMKGSGMRWSMAGGQAVLTFRALHKSGRFRPCLGDPVAPARAAGERQRAPRITRPRGLTLQPICRHGKFTPSPGESLASFGEICKP